MRVWAKVLSLTVVGSLLLLAPVQASGSDGRRNCKTIDEGFGVNYFSAFSRAIGIGRSRDYAVGFRTLSRYRVPFARVMIGAYWPSELSVYVSNRAMFFNELDLFVGAARAADVCIVANLNWNFPTIPDLVGEDVSAWGDPDSKTWAFYRQYLREVVGRYASHPSIAMWEFSNEMSLYVDLPNAGEFRPEVNVHRGTASARTERDELSSQMMAVALREFVRTVREIDSKTLLSTGGALPRRYAFNNSARRSWENDSRQEFCEVLLRDNPVGYSVISVHAYANSTGYFERRSSDLSDVLAETTKCARRGGRPVFLGEFGVRRHPNPAVERSEMKRMIKSIEDAGIKFGALWVFDFQHQESSFNVTEDNGRRYVLELLRRMNDGLTGVPVQ